MIKIAAHIPNIHDATSFYRGLSPLSNLRKIYPEIQIDLVREWSYPVIEGYDLAFFQRPSNATELEAIRICKRANKPVIADFDDLFFDIPRDNPAYSSYMNKATQECIINIMKTVDCIWVSTKELKRCIQIPNGSLNEKVYVIPNALNDFTFVRDDRINPAENSKKPPAVLWRGSATHERDIMQYAPEIAEVAATVPHCSFLFVGYNPWFLTERMAQRQAIIAHAMPVGEYNDFVYATAPQMGIVPLHKSTFNKCKSNIAWLEMTWAGAICLVPDWEEWRNPGAITYRNEEDFRAGLKLIVEMPQEKRRELNKMSWDYIKDNLLLSKTNVQRYTTIRAALGDQEWPDGWDRIADPDETMELD